MAVYRLAFHLGKTKSELFLDLSGSRELAECIAFLDIEPIEEDENIRTANTMAAIYNASGRVKTAKTASDFLPERVRRYKSIKAYAIDAIAFFRALG